MDGDAVEGRTLGHACTHDVVSPITERYAGPSTTTSLSPSPRDSITLGHSSRNWSNTTQSSSMIRAYCSEGLSSNHRRCGDGCRYVEGFTGSGFHVAQGAAHGPQAIDLVPIAYPAALQQPPPTEETQWKIRRRRLRSRACQYQAGTRVQGLANDRLRPDACPPWEHGSVSNRVIGVTSVGSWGSHRALKRFHRSRAVDILMTRDAMPFSSQCFRPAVIV